MKSRFSWLRTRGSVGLWTGFRPALAVCTVVAALGCSSLNPAFVDILDADGGGSYVSMDNAPGHVVLSFVNNAVIDERIISYLESVEGGSLELTAAEKRSLRPLMRFRLRVTFTDETTQSLEFLTGSRIVDPRLSNVAEQDFAQNDFTNCVVLCDVERIELLPNSNIEVYLPVAMDYYVWQQAQEGVEGEFRLQTIQPPGYYPLQVDVITETGFTIQSNIGVRDVVAPVVDPGCGTSISIVASGALAVPFLAGRGVDEGQPGVNQNDQLTVPTIGGRYSFEVSIR